MGFRRWNEQPGIWKDGIPMRTGIFLHILPVWNLSKYFIALQILALDFASLFLLLFTFPEISMAFDR